MFPLGARIGNPNSTPIAMLFRPVIAQPAPPSLFDTRPRRSPPFSLGRRGTLAYPTWWVSGALVDEIAFRETGTCCTYSPRVRGRRRQRATQG
jgi:hypothetical protein